jgi:hypothetical protein
MKPTTPKHDRALGWQAVEAEREQYRMLFELASAAYLLTDPAAVIQGPTGGRSACWGRHGRSCPHPKPSATWLGQIARANRLGQLGRRRRTRPRSRRRSGPRCAPP